MLDSESYVRRLANSLKFQYDNRMLEAKARASAVGGTFVEGSAPDFDDLARKMLEAEMTRIALRSIESGDLLAVYDGLSRSLQTAQSKEVC